MKDFKIKDMEDAAAKNGTNVIFEINKWLEEAKNEVKEKNISAER